jgi:DNA-binding Lrp family transcriptional regulator
MGQVTDRDIEMVNLLIREPNLSLDELGTRLGITKQAAAERKNKLEEAGFTKNFCFWNVTPRFECTKRVLLRVEKGSEEIDKITRLLDRFNPVVVFFKTQPEEFFEGKASSLTSTISEIEGILHFNNEEEEEDLRSELEKFGIAEASVDSVLFSRLLGENCDITVKTQEQVERIARNVAEKLFSEASVQAVLYEKPEHPVDQFDLIVIRDVRFQPETDSYERRVEETLIDYHFTNLRWFMRQRSSWIKRMRIIYTQNEPLRRKLQTRINNI